MDDLTCPSCGKPMYEAGIGFHGACRACNSPGERDEIARLPSRPAFVYVYDAYVRVAAHSKAEADRTAEKIEATVSDMECAALVLFAAYGVEDAETGAALREVD